jgi:hypothetical protein
LIYKSPEYKINYMATMTEESFEGVLFKDVRDLVKKHKSQEKQDVFSVAITAIFMIFPEVSTKDLTFLSSEGKNLEKVIK